VTDTEIRRRIDHAHDTAEAAAEHTPSYSSWGLESYGDQHAALGGGVGGFLWFGDRNQLFEFLRIHLLFFSFADGSSEVDMLLHEINAVVTMLESGERSLLSAIGPLNELLKGHSQLRWIGRFQDLVEGDGEFEREVRSWSRGETDDGAEGSDTPIEPHELDDFIKSLLDWGL
jgi:hypothetical protein